MNVRGSGLAIAALAAFIAIAAAAAPVARAQSSTEPASTDGTSGPTATTASEPTVLSSRMVVPKRRKVIRRRFRPWAQPGPRRVRTIIRIEARRWHVAPASLARRVGCESRFRWWAGNGIYQGLLQFSPAAFYRGVRTIRSRRVRLIRKRVRRLRGRRVIRYSDGHVVRRRGRLRRQRVIYVYRGRLPRRPSITHAWTQLRIGAQAIRGMSSVHTSEWSCPA